MPKAFRRQILVDFLESRSLLPTYVERKQSKKRIYETGSAR
jgi:hypothetical protein